MVQVAKKLQIANFQKLLGKLMLVNKWILQAGDVIQGGFSKNPAIDD